MKRMPWVLAAALIALPALTTAQKPDPDAAKLADQYQAAFNKADVKAIGALYTPEATRLGPDGSFVKGRAAIEKVYSTGFTSGPLKGATLTLTNNSSHEITSDVKVIEGSFTTTGAAPLKGRYVNTIVKKGGTWLLASVVAVPETPPPAAPKK